MPGLSFALPSAEMPHRSDATARSRPWGLAAVGCALIVLIVGGLVGAYAADRAAARTELSELLNAALQQAAAGIAAEESLEGEYRLQPGPGPLAAHAAAETRVATALSKLDTLGDTGDRALVTQVSKEHQLYIVGAAALFRAVQEHQPASVVNAIDISQVEPTFSAMQSQIYRAADLQSSESIGQLTLLRRTDGWVFAANVVSLIVGVALIVISGLSLTRSRRRLNNQSELNRHQALHDNLTGLPNRTLFQDRAEQALRSASRTGNQVAVMLVDIDRFKDVNDTLGHHYGDLLLTQIAERYAAALRSTDSVARFGGDEFAVLLPSATRQEALVVAQRLTDALSGSFTVKDVRLDIEASIGIAMALPDTDVETVMRHADVAMYEAKSQHVPFVVYELARDDNTVDRLALLGDLRRAISGGELVLHYQPKVNVATGEVHSVEALVRWEHPVRGLLAPDQFIPLAESTAVIHPLTSEVLRQALTQARVWLDRGWRIPVAVNVSAGSLHDLAFASHVQKLLDAIGVPAELLSVELTESAIMVDPCRALSVLEALNDLGISLSIDDFGTGYSSMAYLKDMPVKELKIDRSFVSGMASNEGDVVLVQSAVDLGHNLGLHVVAEGVEDAATQARLSKMGCDLVQGYHIRRPAPAADLDDWLCEHAHQPAVPTTP